MLLEESWQILSVLALLLLCWYKSTNTDCGKTRGSKYLPLGTQFTCFTSTKVQILTAGGVVAVRLTVVSRARSSVYWLYYIFFIFLYEQSRTVTSRARSSVFFCISSQTSPRPLVSRARSVRSARRALAPSSAEPEEALEARYR